MSQYQQLLNELDGLLGDIGILKADGEHYEYVESIRDLLLGHLDDVQKETINEVLRSVYSSDKPTITKADFTKIKKAVSSALGMDVNEAMQETLLETVTEVYGGGQEVVLGFRPTFIAVDTKAVEWLQKDCVYWVGNHYGNDMREKLLSISQDIVESGISRKDAAELLESSFGDEFSRSRTYWDGLANHVVTRGREFGSVSGYETGGIQRFQVLAHIDSRTSDICREMNGRIIEVAKAVELRDSLLDAATPEDVKTIAPWKKGKDIKGKKTKDLPVGMSLPPYHFKCRTTTVAVEDDAKEDENKS